MVQASLEVLVKDIFLNSLLVTALNKAFNALLLKFTALILASSQSASTSVSLVQPISTACHTFSSKDCKKALMHTQQKPHQVIFRSPLLKFHYYHNKRLQARNPKYLTNLQLNPYPNTQSTCSIVTVPLSNARLPSTWLTNCADPSTRLQSPIWNDCWLQSSSVHLHDKDQEDAWSQNPMVQIHSNFSKKEMN